MHKIQFYLDEKGRIFDCDGLDADYWLSEGDINEAQAATIRKLSDFISEDNFTFTFPQPPRKEAPGGG